MRHQTPSATPAAPEDARVAEQHHAQEELMVPAAHSMETVPRPRDAVESQAQLVVSRGPEVGQELTLTQPSTSFGRHRDCDVVLDDTTVSRYHAEVLREDGRYFLVDDGSLNGTYLNRKPVDRAELADGDEVWIGKARFVFRIAG